MKHRWPDIARTMESQDRLGPIPRSARTAWRANGLIVCILLSNVGPSANADEPLTAASRELFETRVRPVLVEHCYRCHSSSAKEIKGGLRLDLRAGWQEGGESGEPAIQPGKPDESLLLMSIRHDSGVSAMPPDRPRLSDAVLADLSSWIAMGAPDPRDGVLANRDEQHEWERVFRERLEWWSLQPIRRVQPPADSRSDWVRNDVDRFILAGLESKGLSPASQADARALIRRLSFALTGLPPSAAMLEQYADNPSPDALDRLTDALLASPQFGERWARHWMDVVHYADSHGYEWDVPAKNAWRYRDYLVRAFNADLPYRQLVLEQIAGDLIEPRVNRELGVIESLLGPMALRLGERRHGDNAAAEGVTQEAITNIVDTASKGFLGTTVACAACHDHKLDALSQRDFYALFGMFMSTRWGPRTVDADDPNLSTLAELREIKQQIRAKLSANWLASKDRMAAAIQATPIDPKRAAAFPDSLTAFWHRSSGAPLARDEFTRERDRRAAENRTHLKLLADFTTEDGSAGWRWDGFGLRHGRVRDGEIVLTDEGDALVEHLLPAGRWSHVWSKRLAGALRSPLFDAGRELQFSVGLAGGMHAAHAFNIDHAFHSERMQFLKQPEPGWLTLTAGRFDTLEGSIDRLPRRVYLEIATKSLNNYFPPRWGYNGIKPADEADERSWFGVTRIWEHPPGHPPLDELGRFAPLFADGPVPTDPWPDRLARLILAAVDRWSRDQCDAQDVLLINEALQAGWLSNNRSSDPELAPLVDRYRAVERQLQPDRTIGSADDWHEGADQPIGTRGSYTEFGEVVPRGNIRFLGGPASRSDSAASGRLEFAQQIASDDNPLTARVFVNRVWHHLFGAGLVRTTDDFGHLGDLPSHPELLDYLAHRFMAEGWSLKRLVRLLVTSAAWRQGSVPSPAAVEVDPENRLWHHLPLRRLDAEAIRDALLAVSGRLDRQVGGPPIDPFRSASDPSKRLVVGPLDGEGRRSLYLKMTLMEPPRFLATFNQPIPKLTTGRRDVTNVPDQALALLNDPFVVAMAASWSGQLVRDGLSVPQERLNRMFVAALGRPPDTVELDRLERLVARSASLRHVARAECMTSQPVWQDVAHAIVNLKEFIHVR